jgi:single-strand DNA-binding protein
MAEGLNKVLLFGNLGADPELKMTQSGQAVLKLRLATTERYQDKSGVWQDRTEWHSVVVWGKRAEGLHKILAKGSTIFVEGSLRTSSYEDREGNKRYKTEVSAQRVLLAGGRGGGGARAPMAGDDDASAAPRGGAGGGGGSRERTPAPAPADDAPPPDDFPVDDDLPF